MQYLLTEEERVALVPKDELVKANLTIDMARAKLLLLAGFDCIHDKKGTNARGYCSRCPCSPIKDDDGLLQEHEAWSRICRLTKNYPQ